MNIKFILVGCWVVTWILLTTLLVDYLPQHPHIKYATLLSPFILFTALLDFKDLLSNGIPKELIAGIIFWIVSILLLALPIKKKSNLG